MHYRDSDIGLGVVLILLSGIGLISVSTIAERTTASDIGPKTYPTILLIILMICGLSLIIQGIWRKKKKAAPSFDLKRVIPMTGLLLFYAFAFDIIGFIASTFIFLIGAMVLLGERRIFPILAISLIFSVGVYYLFGEFLMIAFP